MADPATFLHQTVIWGPYFPLITACTPWYCKHKNCNIITKLHSALVDYVIFVITTWHIWFSYFPDLSEVSVAISNRSDQKSRPRSASGRVLIVSSDSVWKPSDCLTQQRRAWVSKKTEFEHPSKKPSLSPGRVNLRTNSTNLPFQIAKVQVRSWQSWLYSKSKKKKRDKVTLNLKKKNLQKTITSE